MGRPRKPIYGVGVNDAPYNTEWTETETDENGGLKKVHCICPFFKSYKSMMYRCYSESLHKRVPSYKDCVVDPRWHRFLAFKEWMEAQDWMGKHLDKDLLVPGNKVYGPDTCCFIDREVNQFIQQASVGPGDTLYGVCYCSHTPRPKCQFAGKHVGYFETEEEAHEVWREMKHKKALEMADRQKCPKVAGAIRARYADHAVCCGSRL